MDLDSSVVDANAGNVDTSSLPVWNNNATVLSGDPAVKHVKIEAATVPTVTGHRVVAAPADRVITINVGVQGSLLVWDPLGKNKFFRVISSFFVWYFIALFFSLE